MNINFRWFIPFIGHTGIGTSTGVIRDFAGPYYVSENNMAFGKPTRYLQLNTEKVAGAMNKKERIFSPFIHVSMP